MHPHNNKTSILLSIAYLPPIGYLKSIVDSENILIEQFENYLKQSYRNRCRICAANGVLDLSIPIVLATRKKIVVRDVKIDYSVSWQKQHFKSIESAYRTSPFFDYLADDFMPFYTKNFEYLLDFNLGLLNTILDILQVEKQLNLTTDFEHNPVNKTDLRNFFSPKKKEFIPELSKPYPQVFGDKHGFVPNLSCIDLIFNLGPQAYSYLIGKY